MYSRLGLRVCLCLLVAATEKLSSTSVPFSDYMEHGCGFKNRNALINLVYFILIECSYYLLGLFRILEQVDFSCIVIVMFDVIHVLQ